MHASSLGAHDKLFRLLLAEKCAPGCGKVLLTAVSDWRRSLENQQKDARAVFVVLVTAKNFKDLENQQKYVRHCEKVALLYCAVCSCGRLPKSDSRPFCFLIS